MIGDSAVGKSNICLRFARDQFNEESLSTIGVEFIVKEMNVGTKKISLQVWDTGTPLKIAHRPQSLTTYILLAGQDRFRALTGTYFRRAVGALLVYDITNRTSFEHLEEWLNELHQYIAADEICVLIVANKSGTDDLLSLDLKLSST